MRAGFRQPVTGHGKGPPAAGTEIGAEQGRLGVQFRNHAEEPSHPGYGLGAAVAALALSNVGAFAPPSSRPHTVRRYASSSTVATQPRFTIAPLHVLSEEQTLHTAERLAGMSRGEIQHIFEDVDSDGNGNIDVAELDLLAKYFPSESFTPEMRKRLMKEIDTDGNGVIDIRELGLMMNALGENMSPDEVGNMLAEADADGDGVINFEEFKVIMSMDRSVYASDSSDVEEEVVEEEDVPEEPASEPETSSTSGSIADVIAHLDTLKLFGAKRRYIESLSSEVFDFNLTIESMDKTIGIGLSDEFRGGHTCIGTVDGIGVGVRMPNTMELEIGQEIYVEAKLLEYRSVVKRFEFEQL